MEKLLTEFFENEKIKYYSCLDVDECTLLYPRKLPAFTKSVCFFLMPYFTADKKERNVSLYAVPRDYHLYVKELEKRLLERIKASGKDTEVSVFSDNSPFSERICAEKANLGIIGKNRLLINSEYGSYTFIGSICISHNISISHLPENFKCDICGICEKCKTACPYMSGETGSCLSELTQKKNLSDEEMRILSTLKVRWGCDICQSVCPKNKSVSETLIEFFKKQRIERVTAEQIRQMTDEEFSERAYSWRGKNIILRNLNI